MSANLHSNPHSFDARTVRRLFNDATVRLSEADFLLREIATRMQERLEYIVLNPSLVVDLACGLGQDSVALAQRFSQAQVLALDAAHHQIQQARQPLHAPPDAEHTRLAWLKKWLPFGLATTQSPVQFACADFAVLPLKSARAQLLWSNLALHWHAQPDVVFKEWARVLQVGGLAMFSTFGPETCIELRQAFQQVDHHSRVIHFVDMHDLGDMLVAAQFADPVMDSEKITVRYQDPYKLMREMRHFGGNPFAQKRQGLIGRKTWERVVEQLRTNQGDYALTFEIIYGHAWKSTPKRNSEGLPIIQFKQAT